MCIRNAPNSRLNDCNNNSRPRSFGNPAMAIQSQELKRKERINGMQELDNSLSGNEKAKILIFERPLEIQESLKIITNLPERIKTLKHFILMKFSLPENKRPIKVETKLRLDCKLGHMADILESRTSTAFSRLTCYPIKVPYPKNVPNWLIYMLIFFNLNLNWIIKSIYFFLWLQDLFPITHSKTSKDRN